MKNHWKHLLPFSPDTSGFASVVSATDGAGIIDDPQGCATNYWIYEEDRDIPQRVFNSQLNNMDVVFGSEEKLIKRYSDAAKALEPSFVLLGGSPVSALIGTDLEAAAKMLAEQNPVACAPVRLTGDAYYHKGVANTYMAIAGLLFEGAADIHRTPEVLPGSVNLLGCCLMDIGIGGADAALRLAQKKYTEVISSWGKTGCTFTEMGAAGRAGKNLVLSADAVPLAEYLKKKFGTPWEIWFPFLSDTGFNGFQPADRSLRCLILGEPLICRGIKTFMTDSLGMINVTTAGFFTTEPFGYDRNLQDEEDLTELLGRLDPDVLIGDPAFCSLARPDVRTVPFLHRAVSGKHYTDEVPDYPDETFKNKLIRVLE